LSKHKYIFAIFISLLLHFAFIFWITGDNQESEIQIAKKSIKKGFVQIHPLSSIYKNKDNSASKQQKLQTKKKKTLKNEKKVDLAKNDKNPIIIPEKEEIKEQEHLINISGNEILTFSTEIEIENTDDGFGDEGFRTADNFSSGLNGDVAGSKESNVEILSKPEPKYPYFAFKRGFVGTVVLSIEVLPTGEPGEIKILESSGYKDLDNAAKEVIPKWKFNPKYVNGLPTVGETEQKITFKIES